MKKTLIIILMFLLIIEVGFIGATIIMQYLITVLKKSIVKKLTIMKLLMMKKILKQAMKLFLKELTIQEHSKI